MQALTKYTWGLILMLSMTTGLGAQTQDQFIKAAETYYDYGDYANAAFHFGEAMKFDTTYQPLRFRRGESNLRYLAYKRALKDFARIELDGASSSFPLLPYLQGKATLPLGYYDAAIDHFSRFLDNPGMTSADTIADAERQLNNAEWAMGEVAAYKEKVEAGTQSEILPIHYTDVNTRFDDFGPSFERDQFYFSSLRFRIDKDSIKPTRKIARIFQRNAEGNQALNKSLPESINQKDRTAAHSAFNSAGTRVYFTYCEYLEDELEMRCDLYSAPVSTGGTWGTPQKLPINASGANNTHPNVGMHRDGSEFLYFASDRSGGRGMHDLYRTPIGADGTLGSVESLDKLNTRFDDVTPFYYAPNHELYFSTDGRNTLGGLDIYRASMGKTDWMAPIHLGLPTNSSYNDVYYTRYEEQDFAYFASNRHTAEAIFWDEDQDVCCNDIYKVEIEKICLEVTTFHALTKAELNATTVTFYEEHPESGERIEPGKEETHPNDNFYTFEVEKDRKYVVTGVKWGFKDTMTTVDVNLSLSTMQVKEGECIKAELYLRPPTIKLNVATYSKLDDSERNDCNVDNGSRLNGTTVDLSTSTNEQRLLPQDASEINKDSNFYAYSIELERFYKISGRKNDYIPDPDIAFVDTRGLFVLNDTTICRNLLLKRPLPCLTTVFFHNDIPKKGNPHTTTPEDYMDTYNTYTGALKGTYYRKWADRHPNPVAGKLRLDEYFDNEVVKGAEELKELAAMLKDDLPGDGSLTITLEGFASPRAKSAYNRKLSARRCISVINYLLNYDGEVLRQYMKNAVILIDNAAPEVSKQAVNVVPPTYTYDGMDIPVVAYQGDTPPLQTGKTLIFHIKPGGEVPVDSIPNLVDTGDDSIYSPVAAAQRYVEITIEGCVKQSAKEIPEPDLREY